MFVIGTNTWERDIPKKALIAQALRFSEKVKAEGIAELRDFWLAWEQKWLWCTWETENLKGLKKAFAEMNKQSGLKSELKIVEKIFPK